MSLGKSDTNASNGDAPATAWLVELLRTQLAGVPAPSTAPETDLWPAIVAQAGYHKLVPHLCRALDASPDWRPAPAQRMALVARRAENRRRCTVILAELERLGILLGAAGIPWLAFKGVALAAQVGLPPDGRESTDLDLYVGASRLQEAQAVLAAAGYRHAYDDERDRALRSLSLHHGELGLDVDLHHAFTAKRFFVGRALVLPCEGVTVDCGGQAVMTLSPEAQLLVALVNGAKERWHGLARVFDSAALARLPGLDWDRLAALCPPDYRRVMNAGLTLVNEVTGSPLPAWLATDNRCAAYCRRLARERFGDRAGGSRGFAAELLAASEFKWRLSVRGADHRRVLADAGAALGRLVRERAGPGPAGGPRGSRA